MAAIDQVDCSKRFVTRRSQQPFVVVEIGEALPNEQRFGWNGTAFAKGAFFYISRYQSCHEGFMVGCGELVVI